MATIKLTIEYDGTAYAGWQFQPNGLAVQQVMEDALACLLGERVCLHSSGRTDAGVHAKGMIACFRTERALPLSAYTEGLNGRLPPDIAVVAAEFVAPDFNPRHDAKGKHYRYTVRPAQLRSPLSRLYAWQLRGKLDLQLMREGAAFFVGEHDFAAFRTSGCAAKATIRKIDSVEIVPVEDLIHINVIGSGFMRNMVRIMVGTLVEIGKGKMPPEHIRRCLTEYGARPGPTAPPQGLCLIEVYY